MDRKEIVKHINLKVEKFEDFRKDKGLTKSQFCKLCHVSLSTYNKILSQEYDFCSMPLFKILRKTNLNLEDVF